MPSSRRALKLQSTSQTLLRCATCPILVEPSKHGHRPNHCNSSVAYTAQNAQVQPVLDLGVVLATLVLIFALFTADKKLDMNVKVSFDA